MKTKQIKFLYNGDWTSWFDVNEIPNLNGLQIQAVMIQEYLNKAEYETYVKEREKEI